MKEDKVIFGRDEALKALVDLNYIAVSLANIDRYYSLPSNNNLSTYQHEIGRFVLEQRVTKRLFSIRAILTSGFDLSLGEDDMDDIERACENIEYWKPSVD